MKYEIPDNILHLFFSTLYGAPITPPLNERKRTSVALRAVFDYAISKYEKKIKILEEQIADMQRTNSINASLTAIGIIRDQLKPENISMPRLFHKRNKEALKLICHRPDGNSLYWNSEKKTYIICCHKEVGKYPNT